MAMLENFKALSQLKQQLDDLQSSVKATQESVNLLTKDMGTLRSQTQDAIAARNAARQEQLDWTKNAQKAMDEVQELRIKLTREINAMDQVKRELAVTVAKRVETELRNSIGDATAELKSKVLDVKSAREALESLSSLSAKATESVNRLHFIATDIKTKDFELSKALDTIKTAEREKIELQQRLDKAESYAAKEVRRMKDSRTTHRF